MFNKKKDCLVMKILLVTEKRIDIYERRGYTDGGSPMSLMH